MIDDNDNKSAASGLAAPAGSTRFHYDSESGFVYDRANQEWLTTCHEVFLTMSECIDDVFEQWKARQKDYDAAQRAMSQYLNEGDGVYRP